MATAANVKSGGNSFVESLSSQPAQSPGLSLLPAPDSSKEPSSLVPVIKNVKALPAVLELAPVRRRHSRMDVTKEITREMWAITMICARNTSHAQLIIEGVKITNSRFTYLAELTAGSNSSESGHNAIGRVNYRAFKRPISRPVMFDGKSETWQVARNLIKPMLRQIKNETNDPQNYPRAFHITGRASRIPRRVVYVKGEGAKELSWGKTIKAEIIGLFGLGPIKYIPVISIPWNVYLMCNPDVANGLFAYAAAPHVDKGWNGLRDIKEAELYKMGCALAQRHGVENVKFLRPDNCITWAKEKLQMINIAVPDGPFDQIITMTRLVTNPNGCSVQNSSGT